MLLRIIGSFFVILAASTVFGQINIQWESRLDGDGSFIDKAVDLELDASGNTYVTGSSYDGTSYDLVTVKYDPDGVELWRSSYGGAGLDDAHALTLDSNNDVIVTGSRFISGSDWDIVTIKYNGSTGAEIWSNIHAGSALFDFGSDVAVDASDNVIVCGTRGFGPGDVDVITLKYDSGGTFLWEDWFGAGGSDEATVVTTDAAGNIYVGGFYEFSAATTFVDFLLVKYNAGGTTLFAVTQDSDFGQLDKPNAIALDPSGDIILAGSGFTDILNEQDYLTMKFDNATGALDWKALYAGDAEDLDVINALAVDGSGNIFVTGKSKSVATSEDYYTIAYDGTGAELWSDRYTTAGLEYDEATDIKVSDSDLNVYVSGYSFYAVTNNDFTTLKYTAADGSIEWSTVFDGPSSNSDQALKMELDPSENIFITGNSHGGATNLDYSTIKYCQLTTTASPDTSVCDGGSVVLNATGGSDVTWEVLTGDAGSMSCSVCETMTATPSETTTYIVSSVSLSGCVDYDTVLVVVNANPSPTIYNDTPLDFCDGGSVTLYTDTYDSYDWSTGGVDSFTVVLTEGTINLTVIDSNTCTAATSVDVTVYDLPTIDVGDDLAVCPEGTVELSAMGATSYVWDTDVTLSSLIISNPIASPVGDTEYKVTGTDDNGCTGRDSLIVSIHDLPSVNAGSDETICIGDSVHLNATGATSYVWDASPTLSELGVADPWATPTTLTEYFVTGTDDNGCTNRDSVNVSTLGLPSIDAGEDDAICTGGSVELFATGGLPGMYVWNDDPTLSETDVHDPIATPLTGTNYVVQGTDVNGCSNTDTVFVDVYALPAINAGADDAICLGDSIQLEATGGVDYTWDSDPTLSALGIADPWANPVTTKTYTVTGVDVNGCENEDEVTIVVNEIPVISAGDDVTICDGDSTQLNATGGAIYTWDFDPTLSNFVIGDPWAQPTATTTYVVTGTDGEGCSNTDEVVVTVLPLPIAPVLTTDSVFIISSIAEGNQWYHESGIIDDETNDTLNYFEIGMNGEYWVVYTGDNGCSIESNRIDNPIVISDVSIEENEADLAIKLYPNPTLSMLNVEFEDGLDQMTVLSLGGRIVKTELNLAPGLNQFNIEDLPAGTYLVQFIKGNQVTIKKVVKQ